MEIKKGEVVLNLLIKCFYYTIIISYYKHLFFFAPEKFME